MQTYRCSIHNLKINTSVCPQCMDRAHVERESDIYWCADCNVPLYTKMCPICGTNGRRIASDIRPVFSGERLLLEILSGEPFCYAESSVWNTSGNDYIVDGEKIGFSIRKALESDVDKIRAAYNRYAGDNTQAFFEKYIQRFILCNQERMAQIETEALQYIKEVAVGHDGGDMFVSFSGGKDSTVTSDLVMRALGDPRILHIFGDTTLEFPDTEKYVARFRKEHPFTPVLSSRNKEKDFFSLCRQIGPPSRIMRWCCTIFKTGAIHRKIDALFRGQKNILAFYGIRRSESASRSKYDRESEGYKITRQRTISPVIDWMDFDIWLYLLTKRLDFNDAYRLGYARVGCWCCPNNGVWSEFLSKIHMPDKSKEWRDFLIRFAQSIGKPDAEEYVDTGKWKARQGGNGISYAKKSLIAIEPCVREEDTFVYELQKEISEDLYGLMCPIGYIDRNMGNGRLGEVYVNRNSGQPILRLKGKIGKRTLRITLFDYEIDGTKSLSAAEEKVKCQLVKYQMCIGCRACEGICPKGAIRIECGSKGEVHYRVLEEKCTRCGKCVNHFMGGCYMRKVLATSQEKE